MPTMTAADQRPQGQRHVLGASAQKLSARLAYSLRIDSPSQPPRKSSSQVAAADEQQRANPGQRRSISAGSAHRRQAARRRRAAARSRKPAKPAHRYCLPASEEVPRRRSAPPARQVPQPPRRGASAPAFSASATMPAAATMAKSRMPAQPGSDFEDRPRFAGHDAVGPEGRERRQQCAVGDDRGNDDAELVEAQQGHWIRRSCQSPSLRGRWPAGQRGATSSTKATAYVPVERPAYFKNPFFFRKSSATALAGSPPTCTRPLRSCSVARSSFSNTGFSSSSIFGFSFSTASRMIGAGW